MALRIIILLLFALLVISPAFLEGRLKVTPLIAEDIEKKRLARKKEEMYQQNFEGQPRICRF